MHVRNIAELVAVLTGVPEPRRDPVTVRARSKAQIMGRNVVDMAYQYEQSL